VFQLGVLLGFFLEVGELTELTVLTVALAIVFLLGPSSVTIHHVTQAETRDHKRALHKFCVVFAVAEGTPCEESEVHCIHTKKPKMKNENKRVKHVKKQCGWVEVVDKRSGVRRACARAVRHSQGRAHVLCGGTQEEGGGMTEDGNRERKQGNGE
jgi:hypothetical protein